MQKELTDLRSQLKAADKRQEKLNDTKHIVKLLGLGTTTEYINSYIWRWRYGGFSRHYYEKLRDASDKGLALALINRCAERRIRKA